MKLTTKQILISLGIVIIIASIAGKLYFGGIKIKDNIDKKGFNDGQINLANQIKSGVRINYEDGVILFVPAQ